MCSKAFGGRQMVSHNAKLFAVAEHDEPCADPVITQLRHRAGDARSPNGARA
jgi:hypothetical protein